MYDSLYMRYLEESNSQRHKVKWWLPRIGNRGRRNEELVNMYRVSVAEDEKV